METESSELHHQPQNLQPQELQQMANLNDLSLVEEGGNNLDNIAASNEQLLAKQEELRDLME